MLAGQQLEPAVLGVVGVLVLVDQDEAEGGRVAVADLLEELEQVDRADEQVVEVHRVHAVQLALVVLVDVRDGLLEVGADELAVVVGGAQLVLGVGDLRLHRARGEALDVDVEVVEALLDQPPLVRRVVDRELARVAEPVGVGAQHPGAGGVEGHHPHRARGAADQQLDALAHLLRGLVGERDREDLVGAGLARAQQVGDPVGEHAGLARAGAGQDQQRPLTVDDRLALGLVEALEELVGRRGGRHGNHDIPRPGGSAGRDDGVRRRCWILAGVALTDEIRSRLRARRGVRAARPDRARRDRGLRRIAALGVAAGARSGARRAR